MNAPSSPTLARRSIACAVDAATLILWVTILARSLALAFPSAVPYLSWTLFLVFWFSYRIVGEGLYGLTIGKVLTGLRVVDARSGSIPGLRAAIYRTLLRPIDGFPGVYLVGAVFVLLSPEGLRLGDRVAGTRVTLSNVSPPSLLARTERHPDPERENIGGDRKPSEKPRTQVPPKPQDVEAHQALLTRLKALSESGTWYVFDRDDLFILVGPGGLVLLQPQYEPGELVVDEDGLQIFLNSRPAAVDPLARMRSHMLEADRRLSGVSNKHHRDTIQEQLGQPGHHWYLCYTSAALHDRLSLGTLRPHVITLSDVPEVLLRTPPAFEHPKNIEQLASEVAKAYDIKPVFGPPSDDPPEYSVDQAGNLEAEEVAP